MPKPFLRAVLVVAGCTAVSLAIAQNPTGAPPTPPPGGAPGTAPAHPLSPPGRPEAARPAAPSTPEEQKKALYALGALLGRNLDGFTLSAAEFNTVKQGLTDAYHHSPQTKDVEAEIPQVQALERERVRVAGEAYASKAALAPGAVKTASGMIYHSVKEGTGPTPTRTDRVKVNYEGRLIDGTVFDSSALHGGQPATFPLTGVIPCWTEALQKMKVGGKARVVCPASLAYGERAVPPKIHAGSTLDFNIELLEIVPPPPPPAVPPAGAGSPTPPPVMQGTPPRPGAPASPASPGSPPPST